MLSGIERTSAATKTGPMEVLAEVSANRQVSKIGFLLTLVADIPPPAPGQFVMLALPETAAAFLRRPFSVFDLNSKLKKLEVYYCVAGSGTRVLSRVRRGDKLRLLGPLGNPFPESPKELHVMVGGGRGCAPLVFLSRKRHRTARVFFLSGATCEQEIIPLEKIRASRIFVSTEDGSLGKKGTVLDLLKSAISSPGFQWSRATLYGCGPAGMLRGLHEVAVKNNVPCFVSLEAQMGCGLGICQGCAVKAAKSGYSLVCREGPVFSSSSIDWNSYGEIRQSAISERSYCL